MTFNPASMNNHELDQRVIESDRKAAEGKLPGLKTYCFRDVVAKPIKWLWRNRIALGKVTVLAGEGGQGKSTILCDLAARTSTGAAFPDGETNEIAGNVFILAAEDAADDTLKPRLAAAGADMDRVFGIEAVKEDSGNNRTFNLQADLDRLRQRVQAEGGCRLLIIDPISSYLGKVDSHKNAEVRSVLEPLGRFAEGVGCAVLCNNHFSKGGGSANNRIIGSVAFINHARGAFIVSPDPDNGERMLFLPSKTNIGPKGEGLAYRIGGVIANVDQQEIVTSQVFWESGVVSMTADAALAALSDQGERSAMDEACDFLRAALSQGPRRSNDIKKDAAEQMISARTLRRAREKIGVTISRDGFAGPATWELSHTWPTPTIDDHVTDVGKYGDDGQVCESSSPDPAECDAPLAPDDLAIPGFLDRRGAQ